MRGLAGKVVLITGGASGLGRAMAVRLSAEGAQVVITDIDVEAGHRVASAQGWRFLEQDVGNEQQWVSTIATVEKEFGRLDALINNAGVLGRMDFVSPEDTPYTQWKQLFTINADGVFLGCRAAIPALRRTGGGSIVNISSVAGLLATPYATAYGATKATVRQLTRSVAQYCAQEKLRIRCNSVHPGNVRTPLWDRQAMEAAAKRDVAFARIIEENQESVPLGDFTTSEDVAAGVAFLVSDDSRHITGAKLVIDGGLVHCDTFHLTQLRRRQAAECG